MYLHQILKRMISRTNSKFEILYAIYILHHSSLPTLRFFIPFCLDQPSPYQFCCSPFPLSQKVFYYQLKLNRITIGIIFVHFPAQFVRISFIASHSFVASVQLHDMTSIRYALEGYLSSVIFFLLLVIQFPFHY